MRRFAIALLIAVSAGPAWAQTLTSRTVDTGTAALRVFNTGYFGGILGVPADTTFNFGPVTTAMPSPLYEGQLMVAISPTRVIGRAYSSSPQSTPPIGLDWSLGSGIATVTPPAPFTRALETSYTDAGTSNPMPAGLSITQRALGRTGDAFVVVELDVASATARSGVYIGMFADYDISADAVGDRANYDAATRTVYAWKGTAGGNRNYYGVTLLGSTPVSGWNGSADTQSDAGRYASMTAFGTPQTVNQDRRLTLGTGPFTMAAGVPQRVRFAYVAGPDLNGILANAASAQSLFPLSGEGGPGEAVGMRLSAPTPNPATGSAALAFTLDAARNVRLTLHDVLGRQVAVVAEGARAAGTHPVRVDASALAAGVYVVRLEADGAAVTQRLSVVR